MQKPKYLASKGIMEWNRIAHLGHASVLVKTFNKLLKTAKCGIVLK